SRQKLQRLRLQSPQAVNLASTVVLRLLDFRGEPQGREHVEPGRDRSVQPPKPVWPQAGHAGARGWPPRSNKRDMLFKICSVDHDYLRRSRSPLIEAFRPGPEDEGAVVQSQFI